MTAQPSVTVVVPTYNRSDFIERALDSLLKQNYPADRLDVIAVDDGSTDGTREVLERLRRAHSNFRYLLQENRGPAAARNAAIREARGEIVLFMDDDCIADPNWAAELVRPYSDPKVGGVAGRIRFVPPDDNIANRCAARGTGPGQPVDAEGRIGHFVTANASFRRSVLDEVGGFDTAFPHAAQEDLDLSYRVAARGWRLAFAEAAVVDHYHRHTIRGDLRRWYQVGQAEAIMRRKHGANGPVWVEVPLSLLAFWRIPFGCVRNLVRGERLGEGVMAPVLHRLNNMMLALGRTRGHLAQRSRAG
jgi:GT2 family glycosyltransferase